MGKITIPLLHVAQSHSSHLQIVKNSKVKITMLNKLQDVYKFKNINHIPMISTSRSEPAWMYSGFNFNHFPLRSLGSHLELRSFTTIPSSLNKGEKWKFLSMCNFFFFLLVVNISYIRIKENKLYYTQKNNPKSNGIRNHNWAPILLNPFMVRLWIFFFSSFLMLKSGIISLDIYN